MKPDNVLSMLGIAAKAGGVVSGGYQTEHAVKAGGAYLVIIAEDASENTKKKFRNMCGFYKTRIICYSDGETLGRAIGKEYRVCLALTDKGLAEAVQTRLLQISTE